ncbi:MAG: PatB family C-S lyase [Paludibacter sp.]|jgi:cystathionine beta-lyase|nr:PatB family C-S lyase [Paludibacter sp.]
MYNFDEIIDRHNTNCIKIERCQELFGTRDILPLWVADMDFRTPDFVLDAIKQRLEHPILGYTLPSPDFATVTRQWIATHHDWNLRQEWLGFVPGIVPGLAFAIQTFTHAGDEVIVQPPVYYPFFNVVKNNGRTLVCNQLIENDGKYVMDFEDLEQKISDKTRLLILCNPHNPGGRVWNRDELQRLAQICEKHNILVVSDEIHADMVLPSSRDRHTVFADVSAWAEQNTITFMSPSKVFNMPGLISSCSIIANEQLRLQFQRFLEASEIQGGNIFAYLAAEAAYNHGETWRCEMLNYVQKNIDYVADFLKTNIPQIVPMLPQASFLLWLDCRKLGMESDELHRFFALKAHLGLNKGTIFGAGGEYHLRLNVACPQSVLQTAMQQLLSSVRSLNV